MQSTSWIVTSPEWLINQDALSPHYAMTSQGCLSGCTDPEPFAPGASFMVGAQRGYHRHSSAEVRVPCSGTDAVSDHLERLGLGNRSSTWWTFRQATEAGIRTNARPVDRGLTAPCRAAAAGYDGGLPSWRRVRQLRRRPPPQRRRRNLQPRPRGRHESRAPKTGGTLRVAIGADRPVWTAPLRRRPLRHTC